MLKRIPCPVEVVCSHAPHSIAIISETTNLTYQQLHERILAAQIFCKTKNIRQGNIVAIQIENSPEAVILLFALWRIGAVACLLSPRTPLTEIKIQISKLGSRVLSLRHPAGIASLLAAGNPPTGHPTRSESFMLDASSTIILTSGSSGSPKAVVHTIGNHYFNALGSNENIPVGPGDRWLLSLPLYHVSGLSILWRCVWGGGTIAFSDKEITHTSLVPTQLIRLLKQKSKIKVLQQLKAILLGGGPIPDELIQTARKLKLPVFLTYGLTEMGSQVATSSKSLAGKIKTLKYRQLKIAKDGEVLVRGETLFKGYLKNKKILPSVDQDGWFHTGDLGKLSAKEGLHILGRKDNMFISGGENIYPEEIEKALFETGLVENAVVVPVKNIEFGFRPIAFIKYNHFHCEEPKATRQSILKIQLGKTLPSFKIPQTYLPFPKDYVQKGIKPDRQKLKSLCERVVISF